MKLELSRQIFEKYSNINFRENPFSGGRVVPCGWTDGQTDMTKLVVVFRSFANGPKKYRINETVVSSIHVTPIQSNPHRKLGTTPHKPSQASKESLMSLRCSALTSLKYCP